MQSDQNAIKENETTFRSNFYCTTDIPWTRKATNVKVEFEVMAGSQHQL
jgi:hypothetical protein